MLAFLLQMADSPTSGQDFAHPTAIAEAREDLAIRQAQAEIEEVAEMLRGYDGTAADDDSDAAAACDDDKTGFPLEDWSDPSESLDDSDFFDFEPSLLEPSAPPSQQQPLRTVDGRTGMRVGSMPATPECLRGTGSEPFRVVRKLLVDRYFDENESENENENDGLPDNAAAKTSPLADKQVPVFMTGAVPGHLWSDHHEWSIAPFAKSAELRVVTEPQAVKETLWMLRGLGTWLYRSSKSKSSRCSVTARPEVRLAHTTPVSHRPCAATRGHPPAR